jgi:hypothetical protein
MVKEKGIFYKTVVYNARLGCSNKRYEDFIQSAERMSLVSVKD